MADGTAPSLLEEVTSLLNRHSKENGSDTPDFILAEFLLDSLQAFDRATNMRSRWWSHKPWGEDSAWCEDNTTKDKHEEAEA